MTATRKTIVEIIDELTYAAFYYGIFAIIFFLISSNTADLFWLLLIPVPMAVNFYLRRVFSHLGTLMLMQLVLPTTIIIAMLAVGWRLWGLWVLLFSVLVIHSLVFAFRKIPTDAKGFIALCGAVLCALGFWAAMAGAPPLVYIYPPIILFTIIGRLIFTHMLKMDISLDAINLSNTQPVEQIIAFDYKLVAGLTMVMVVVSLALHRWLFIPVFAVFAQLFPGLPSADMLPGGGSRPEHGHASGYVQDAYTRQLLREREPWLSDSVTQLFFGLFAIVFAIVALYGVYRFVMFILYFRTSKIKMGEKPAADIHDKREFIRPTKRRRLGRILLQANEHPIRRKFKQTAQRHIKLGVPISKSDTPTDMARRIHTEDIAALVEEYSIVRYSSDSL